jgi:hypothetical protein
MTFSLTLMQRLSIVAIIRRQRNASNDDFFTLVDLFKKVQVPEDQAKDIMLPACPTCGSQVRVNMAKVVATKPVDVDFEKAEARRLASLIEGWREFTVDDADWLMPLRAQLKQFEANEPAPAAPPAAAARGPRGRVPS